MIAKLRPRLRPRLASATDRVRRSATAIRTVSGLGFVTASLWVTFGLGAGLAAVGVSWFVVEWLSE